ncbi:MAG: hypothetical protein R2830_05115 [Saprospiraceae bacterium]
MKNYNELAFGGQKVMGAISFLLFILISSVATAQLSPGDLSSPHAHLEGIANCTQCHTLGDKVSNDKCLECHKEIKSRVDQRSGYHYSKEVRGKDCFACHSDHHGRHFDMVHFDEEKFDHGLAGYKLTGAHQKIDCRDCHRPDYVDDRILKKRAETFLGLKTACINCHEDYHQKTLDNDCAKCHSTDAFSPASKFDHDKTDFALLGQHNTVECKDCHQTETRNGKEFQHFAGVAFTNCNACHDDAHKDNLGTDCKQCHTEQAFTSLAAIKRFNHNSTHFPLKGKHNRVDCAGCHNMNTGPTTIFQDRLGVATNACATCHEDVHEGKFGTNCADCHTEESFRAKLDMDNFNHDLTGFALKGKHEPVDCRKCHISESLTDPLPHNTCAACHQDYHEGEFVKNITGPDCAKCHTVDGFSPSQFTLVDHSKSKFPLDGAHLATPCFACHLKENKWHFKNIGERCVDCHEDVHVGEIAEKFYPKQTCENCHLTESWSGVNKFDHKLTAFALAGAHQKTECSACHKQDEEKPHGHFAGLSQSCTACHSNVHGKQFEKDGVTDCVKCHAFESWDIKKFRHDKTAFPLEGKHAEVACEKCHKEAVMDDGQVMVQFKMASFECVDCHK